MLLTFEGTCMLVCIRVSEINRLCMVTEKKRWLRKKYLTLTIYCKHMDAWPADNHIKQYTVLGSHIK